MNPKGLLMFIPLSCKRVDTPSKVGWKPRKPRYEQGACTSTLRMVGARIAETLPTRNSRHVGPTLLASIPNKDRKIALIVHGSCFGQIFGVLPNLLLYRLTKSIGPTKLNQLQVILFLAHMHVKSVKLEELAQPYDSRLFC